MGFDHNSFSWVYTDELLLALRIGWILFEMLLIKMALLPRSGIVWNSFGEIEVFSF